MDIARVYDDILKQDTSFCLGVGQVWGCDWVGWGNRFISPYINVLIEKKKHGLDPVGGEKKDASHALPRLDHGGDLRTHLQEDKNKRSV